MRDVFMFLFGALTGVTTFMVFICCIASGRYSREEEEELREKYEHTNQKQKYAK